MTTLRERPADDRQQLGRRGEEAAEQALRRVGLRVLERRFRTRTGEIDLIAEEGPLLVFVEVKARRGHGYGQPAEAVTARKRQRIGRVALAYLSRNDWLERPCRFDVVEVQVEPGGEESIRHIQDAFRLWPTG